MRKKLLYGALMLLLFLCAPFSQIDLASDIAYSEPVAGPAFVPSDTPVVADGIYTLSLISSVGSLTYYNQSDARWAGHLYGGRDPLASYGCGPTVLAMLVSSFTQQTVTPAQMADWAAANNYWAAGSGTKHTVIPDGAAAWGLQVSSFRNLSEADVISELASGHVLVALMGPGHFTSSGHFIIISDYYSGGQVTVADPANLENTLIPWDIQLILNELNSATDYGGPVWSISP